MEKRFEPMTTAERRKTRLSAFFVVLISGFILTVAYFMLFEFVDTSDDATFNVVKLAFATFFLLVTLFIVGVHVLDAIRAVKMVRTGVVTAKEVRASRGKDADSLAQFVIRLDDTDCTVDADTFTKINVGDAISLTTTRSGNKMLDLRSLENQPSTADIAGRDVLEPIDPAARKIAWLWFVKSLAARLLLVGLVAFLPVIGIVAAYFIDPTLLSLPYFSDVYRTAQLALPILAVFLLMRKPWHIFRDIQSGQSLNEVRTIRDVITSNRRLVGKTGSTSGWGDVTAFTYIDTVDGFFLCSPFPIPVVGKQVVISRLPRSRALLGVYVLE